MAPVKVYTDGSGTKAKLPYGWGAVILNGKADPVELSGGGAQGSNNKAELQAVINALYSLKPGKRPQQVTVYPDARYVVDAFNKGYMSRWLTNGWKNAKGEPVSNRPEWETLLALTEMWHMEVEFVAVKGHNKDRSNPHTKFNTWADRLAGEARKKVAQEIQDGTYEEEDDGVYKDLDATPEATGFGLKEFWKGRA